MNYIDIKVFNAAFGHFDPIDRQVFQVGFGHFDPLDQRVFGVVLRGTTPVKTPSKAEKSASPTVVTKKICQKAPPAKVNAPIKKTSNIANEPTSTNTSRKYF